MKYFIVEGILKSTNEIDKDTMTKHMNYSQKAMDEGLILMSGLKENMSGGIFIMKSDSIENIKEYLDNEPFKLEGIQDYKIVKFSPHYFNESPGEWFK
ncbi:MAG: hypothetical protein KZY55_01550 [Paeniclostridium sp.]|uniref:YciI family protein n=1 Tax=Paraclostridium sordellii TaxID=1505 RepID=UPI0005E2DC14|nr:MULTISPECIES: YciI family protein [Paeniclostridium]MBW4861302.1 hypothetical protein [Paeniclostridium sp.]MBW4872722.1 hypothetical protein [Paeniclostridium sp.]CEN92734.1 YciI-like protein [[Clostridium] sordellii] [Paeniclostridium sordellii]CEN96451.1 YciI-like protein [[Clostridium] sordellii] [Paeniclostridium sordellii]